ncbi:unnamed protein product [Euphydryas editha]|uniref:Uncharacterized protein n=1 Tax=Euphydryas editha TaxID=104508 RepID=A0AAU9V798_EUPED|nr:unnamed protein product [Euphydryas editha]
MDGVGNMLNARFQGLEASGRRKCQARVSIDRTEAPISRPCVTTLTSPANPAPEMTKRKKRKKRKKRSKKGAVAQVAAPPEPCSLPSALAALAEGWNVNGEEGKTGQPNQLKQPAKTPKVPKLRLPRSAAVQLTLLPGSVKTYAEVLGAIKADGVIAGMGVVTYKTL